MTSASEAWKDESVVRAYLEGIRGAIPLAREQIDVVLRLVRASGIEVDSVLDVGCGSGVLASALIEAFPSAHATLVDFSEPMLSEARRQLAPFAERCAIISADLHDPAWATAVRGRAPFAAAVSGFAIHHLPDERKQALCGEIHGLLRAGGWFINIEHVISPTPWLTDRFDDLLIDSYYAHQQAIGSGMTREQVAKEYVHRPDREANILASVEDQCAWLRATGFQDVDCYLKIFEIAVFGGRKAPDLAGTGFSLSPLG
jgi:ubiquinone/menaquinone biosynthesis C-methylase UbiE